MKIGQVEYVMNKYGKAWETQDVNLLLSCFTKSGIYRDTFLKKPFKGHKKIREYWIDCVVNNTKNIRFKLRKCYLSSDGKVCFAEWECDNTYRSQKDRKWRKGKMVGIMILKMKGDKISYLNEYYNSTRNKRERLK